MTILCGQSFSQIEKEIQSYVDSTELLVKNGRKMIYKELNDSNLLKVKEIYIYLNEITLDKQISAFYFPEDIYLNMLVNDWETVNRLMINYEELKQKFVYSDSQDLIYALYALINKGAGIILSSCQQSQINHEAKKIIELILIYIEEGRQNDTYNTLLKSYKKEFPGSKYESFIRDFLPKANIKGSVRFAFGSGMIFKTDELANTFNNSASYNMAMDISIHKVFSSLYLNGSSFKLKEPYTGISGVDTLHFQTNESFTYLDAGLKLGYFLLRNDRFHVAPFGSISGSWLESTRYNDSEDNDLEYEIFNSFTYGVGIHTEIKLFSFPYNQFYYSGPGGGWVSIKFDMGYNKILKFKDSHFQGNMPYVICALVLGFGQF